MNNFYIRFGVHKDRGVLKDMREAISGIVIPAHIFAYSTNATIAAISYIARPFIIDPMTYLLSDDSIRDYVTIDRKTSQRKFKPSITKLVEGYQLTELFQERDFAPLVVRDFTDAFLETFCKNSISFQMNKLNEEKGKAIKKYLDLLNEVGEDVTNEFLTHDQKPAFITTPYFYFDSLNDEWFEINQKVAVKTKGLTDEVVVPVILTNTNCLTQRLLEGYSDFSKIILWVEDLQERNTNTGSSDIYLQKLKKLVRFAKLAKEKNIEIINLYGTYFSMLLSKIGLGGVCNGIFYGEYKSRKTSVGGVPPARYYIRKLHDFYTIPEAISLLEADGYENLLDKDCSKCIEVIDGDTQKIILYDSDHALAQKHFIYSREIEMEKIRTSSLEDLLDDLQKNYDEFSPLPEHISRKSLDYLIAWKNALLT